MGFEIDVQAVVVRYAQYSEPQKSRQIILTLGSPANLIRVHVMRSCASCLVACGLPVIAYLFRGNVILHLEAKVGHCME
jgi:hypothetical protein